MEQLLERLLGSIAAVKSGEAPDGQLGPYMSDELARILATQTFLEYDGLNLNEHAAIEADSDASLEDVSNDCFITSWTPEFGQCFPSIETLARQSHLHRVTVIRCLDSLKQKGLLKWISGGRKKKGRVLSNLYKLTLPKPAPKRDETVLSEFWEDVDNSTGRVAQRNGYPLHSATPYSCTEQPYHTYII